jgi:hypothetical protein
LTEDKINYILDNYLIKSTKELAIHLNIREHNVRSIANRRGVNKRKKSSEFYPEDIWISIPNFSQYAISANGNVRRKDNGILIQPTYTIDNYKKIKLVDDNGKRICLSLHRIVAMVFITNDDPVNKTQVNHKDNIRFNCKSSNLEWVTPSENLKYAYDYGARIEANSYNSQSQINYICSLIDEGYSNKCIKEMINFKIPKTLIWNIRNMRTYQKISKKYKFYTNNQVQRLDRKIVES